MDDYVNDQNIAYLVKILKLRKYKKLQMEYYIKSKLTGGHCRFQYGGRSNRFDIGAMRFLDR